MVTLYIGINEEKQRLDRYIKKYLNNAPNTFIYKILRKNYIKVNNKKENSDYFLNSGDVVTIYLSDETLNKFRKMKTYIKSEELLNIIYEDRNILLVNKPEGIDVQPGENDKVSLLDILLNNLELEIESNTFRPAFCNRLDRNTTGILIAAKNYIALKEINQAIREKKVRKIYNSIIKGKINKQITLNSFLKKDNDINKVNISSEFTENSKEIKTIINPIRSNSSYTEVEIELITGRTHQIRAQLEFIGHPLIGDTKYGGSSKLTNHQLLHSRKIIFLEFDGNLSYLSGKTYEAPFTKEYIDIKAKIFDEE